MSSLSGYFNMAAAWFKAKPNGKDPKGLMSVPVSKETPLGNCRFVVIDTELSGLDRRRDFIVSIGAIKMTGGIIDLSTEFYRLIRPAGNMTNKSIEIHGITPGELEGQESIGEVLPDFLEFIKDSVLVGHFLHIDLMFLNAAVKQIYGKKMTNKAIDTHGLHEWLYENGHEFRKHYRGGSNETNLFSVARQYGISINKGHNALIDAFITAQLFQRFLYFLNADGVHTLNELLDIGRA